MAGADLKSDLLRDLERHKRHLIAFRGNPSIAGELLEQVIDQLDKSFSALNAQAGKVGQSLNDNEWLMAVKSRISIPGGTCEFDLPAYYAWQHHPAEQRRRDLHRWAAKLAPLADAVSLLLRLLRENGVPQKIMASDGQYQQRPARGQELLAAAPASGCSGQTRARDQRESAHGVDPLHEPGRR